MTALEQWAEAYSADCWARMPTKAASVAQEAGALAEGQTAVCPTDRLSGASREWTLEEIMAREG
jgi:hypothetical protein